MKKYLAIDIGGSKLAIASIDEEGKILKIVREEFGSVYTKIELMEKIDRMLVKFEIPGHIACGVAIPGLCDASTGIWIYSSYSHIENFPIAKQLEAVLQIPVFIENDVNLSAIGEKTFGYCKNINDFMWITISNGIGGALILGGKPYLGSNGFSGELGHFVMDESSDALCGCGHRGCLESLASGTGISNAYLRYTGIFRNAREIADLARKGEIEAKRVYAEAGMYLGRAFAYAINLLNIGTIIYGGGLANQDDLFLPSMKASFDSFVFRQANQDTVIRPTDFLIQGASVMGCCALAKEKS